MPLAVEMPAPVMQARRRAPSTCSRSAETCASVACGALGASDRRVDSRLTRVERTSERRPALVKVAVHTCMDADARRHG
eukprot:1106385-Prymnesium_polylepis.2